MPNVKVTVTFTMDDGQTLTASEGNVRLGEDPVLIAAGNLAFGMVEDAWGLAPDEE